VPAVSDVLPRPEPESARARLQALLAPAWWTWIVYGVLGLVFCDPLFEQPLGLGLHDWDLHLFWRASVLKAVIEYGQLPFWNPWYCGGNVLWGNPQVPLISPTYLLTLVMPFAIAMKVDILLHYWAGLAGMHLLLTRGLGVTSRAIAIFLSATFVFSGALVMHVAVGHSNFLAAMYLPALLFLFLRGLDTRACRHALLCGMVLALMIYVGALHIVPMALMAIGLTGLFAAALRRELYPLVLVALIAISGAAYSAPKLVPVARFVTSERFLDERGGGFSDRMTARMIASAYLNPDQLAAVRLVNPRLRNQRYFWHEYGNYVGPFAAFLAVVSIVLALTLPASRGGDWMGRALALAAVGTFLISIGEFSGLSPAAILHRLPLFRFFRIPSRHTVEFVLLAVATIGWMSQRVMRPASSPWKRWLTVGVCGLATLHLVAANRAHFVGAFSEPSLPLRFRPLARPPAPLLDDATSGSGSFTPTLRAMTEGKALIQCYDPLRVRRNADAEQPLVYSEGPVQVLSTTFTPNRVEVSVGDAAGASRLFMNQNYAEGWTSTAGSDVRFHPAERKPSVAIPPGGAATYAFVFAPPGLFSGIAIWIAAVGISCLVWPRQVI
jgi:hypothetical protein